MNQEGRVVLLDGEMAHCLVSSTGGRFIRCFTPPNGRTAEYLLHRPDELHKVASSECVTVVQQDGRLVGYYEGEAFLNDTFHFEGDI